MSDDGYADDAYSAYSDFDDLLYDADPGPDLADDLASHAIHSPLFADEPGYELQEYHSDWEYYSDDYFDDDPGLLKNNPQDGSPLKSQKQPKRGKKRKLAHFDEIPEIDLGERAKLGDCVRGTVWAKPAVLKDNVFRSGMEAKVALMKDWQNHFGTISVQQPGESKRPRLQTDESWANELSLVDMGLLNERGSRLDQPAGPQAAEDAEDEGDEHGSEENGDEEEAVKAALAEVSEAVVDEGAATSEVDDNLLDADVELSQQRSAKTSRRTKEIVPSPPTSTESRTKNGDLSGAIGAESGSEARPAKRARGRPRKSQPQEGPEGSTTEAVHGNATELTVPQTKKRKASASPPARSKMKSELLGTRSTAQHRAQRDALSSTTELSEPNAVAGPTSKRSKKRG